MTPVVEVGAHCQSGWLRCRGLRRGSHPVVGGPYIRITGPCLVGGLCTRYPRFEAVLSCPCGMAQGWYLIRLRCLLSPRSLRG